MSGTAQPPLSRAAFQKLRNPPRPGSPVQSPRPQSVCLYFLAPPAELPSCPNQVPKRSLWLTRNQAAQLVRPNRPPPLARPYSDFASPPISPNPCRASTAANPRLNPKHADNAAWDFSPMPWQRSDRTPAANPDSPAKAARAAAPISPRRLPPTYFPKKPAAPSPSHTAPAPAKIDRCAHPAFLPAPARETYIPPCPAPSPDW